LTGEPGVGKTRLAQECLLARTTVSVRCEAVAQGAALHSIGEALRAALEQPGRGERMATLSGTDRTRRPGSSRRSLRMRGSAPHAETGVVDRSRSSTPGGSDRPARRCRRHPLDRRPALGRRLDARARHAPRTPPCGRSVDACAHRRRRPHRGADAERARRGTPCAHSSANACWRASARGVRRRRDARAGAGPVLDPGGAPLRARLQGATGGNPYYLLETIRFLFDAGELRLDAQGGWSTRYDDATADYAELPVPPSLAATLMERVDRLGAAARRLLETAALTSAGFTLAQVQPATALSEWKRLDGLERAVQAELIATFAGATASSTTSRARRSRRNSGPERRRLIHDRLAAGLIAQQARADLIAMHLQAPTARRKRRLAGRGRTRRGAPARLERCAGAVRPGARARHLDRGAGRVRRARVGVLRTLHDLAGMQAELAGARRDWRPRRTTRRSPSRSSRAGSSSR
jgi:hypothetical protein